MRFLALNELRLGAENLEAAATLEGLINSLISQVRIFSIAFKRI